MRRDFDDAQSPRSVHVRKARPAVSGLRGSLRLRDVLPGQRVGPGFYDGAIKYRYRVLGQVSPPFLYLWGTESDLGGSAAYPKTVLEDTSVRDEGNSGVKARMIESRCLKGAHRSVHLEKKPVEAAEEIGEWLRNEVEKWRDGMRRKAQQPAFSPGTLNQLWLQRLSPTLPHLCGQYVWCFEMFHSSQSK